MRLDEQLLNPSVTVERSSSSYSADMHLLLIVVEVI